MNWSGIQWNKTGTLSFADSLEEVVHLINGGKKIDVGLQAHVAQARERAANLIASLKVTAMSPEEKETLRVQPGNSRERTILLNRDKQHTKNLEATRKRDSLRKQAATFDPSTTQKILDGIIVVSEDLFLEIVKQSKPDYVDMHLEANQKVCDKYLAIVEAVVKSKYPSILQDCHVLKESIKSNSEHKNIEAHASMAGTETHRGGFVCLGSNLLLNDPFSSSSSSLLTDNKETDDKKEEEDFKLTSCATNDILFEAPKKSRSKEKVVFCTKEHLAAWNFGKAKNATYVALLKNTSFSVLHESSKDVVHVIKVKTGEVAVFLDIEKCVEAMRDDNTPVLFRARVDAVGKAQAERISVWKECDGEITDKPLSIERTTTKANDHVAMCSVQERWSRKAHQLSLENGFEPTLQERLIAAASVRRITNLMKALSETVAVQNNSRIAQIVPVVEGGTTLSGWRAQQDTTLNYGTKCWSLTRSLYCKTQSLRAAEHKEIIEVHLIIAKEYLKQAKNNHHKDSYNFYFLNQMGRLINEFVVRFVN